MMAAIAWLIRLIATVIASSAVAAEPVATRLELVGSVADAGPERLSRDRCVWRATDGRTIDVPTDEVVAWGRCPPWPQGPMVLLAGGGAIAGDMESLDESAVVVRSVSLGRLTLPRDAVAGFRRSIAAGPADIRAAAAALPAIVIDLANGDRIEPHGITLRDGSVRIEHDAAAGAAEAAGRSGATVPLDVVRGIDFLPPAPPVREPPRLLVAIEDGSRFAVETVSIPAAAAPARVVLRAAGSRIACDCDREAIVAVAVDGAGSRLVSALDPDERLHEPAVGGPWPLARDRTLAGGWPSARGVTAFSALGIHGPARIRYRLDPPGGRFESLVAIDDSAGPQAAAVVRVRARGGDGTWTEVFASGVLHGADEPLAIGAPLAAATAIELVVEPAPSAEGGLPGGILDRTLWLDPRVVTGR